MRMKEKKPGMINLKNLRIGTKVNVLVLSAVAVLALLLWINGFLMTRSIHETRNNTARAAADVGHGVARYYLEEYKAGNMSLDHAQRRALDHLKNLRYDGGEYYWVNNSTLPYPVMVMHPINPALDGQILDSPEYNVAMGRQQNLFQAFAEVCLKDGEGFVDYLWPRPGETTPVPKMSYVKYLAEWDWIIGTGVYLDTVVGEVRQVTVPIMILVGFTIISVLLVSFTLSSRMIGRPIAALTRAAARLEQGDFSAKLVSETRDEIGHLSTVFNSMTSELARRQDTLKTERNRLVGIIEGTRAGTWEWNVQTGETVFNERWAEIIGYSLDEIGPPSIETWKKYAHPEDLEQSNELLKKHFRKERDYYEFEFRMKHKNGEWIWVLGRGKVVTWTDDDKPLMMMGTYVDITGRKQAEQSLEKSLEEKSILLSEIHHRVKNNMAVISSLLTLQSEFGGQKKDPEKLLKDLQTRILSMAWVHELVYESQNFAQIQSGKLLERLADYLKNSYQPDEKDITLQVRSDDIMLDMNNSVPLTLLIAELLTNAWKHAFSDRRTGRIEVTLDRQKEGFRLIIRDDGVGVANLDKLRQPDSFGYTIVHGLARQLRGELAFSSPEGGGLKVEAWFPGKTPK